MAISFSNSKISNCYNIGTIEACGGYAILGGIVGEFQGITGHTTFIENSYNIGTITGTGSYKYIAGIAGRSGYNSTNSKGVVRNSYCTTETSYLYNGYNSSTSNRDSKENLKGYTSKLGAAFTADVQDEDGNYLNKGYPILKWQIGE